jgi:N-methylhydantoinase A
LDLSYKKPPPFCPRHLRFEVRGRMSHRGEERQQLELADVDAMAAALKAMLAMGGKVIFILPCIFH